MLGVNWRCTPILHCCSRGCLRLNAVKLKLWPATYMLPSELPKGASKRVPSLRTGKGSARGDTPAAGFPASQFTPKSFVRLVEVVLENPDWFRVTFCTLM